MHHRRHPRKHSLVRQTLRHRRLLPGRCHTSGPLPTQTRHHRGDSHQHQRQPATPPQTRLGPPVIDQPHRRTRHRRADGRPPMNERHHHDRRRHPDRKRRHRLRPARNRHRARSLRYGEHRHQQHRHRATGHHKIRARKRAHQPIMPQPRPGTADADARAARPATDRRVRHPSFTYQPSGRRSQAGQSSSRIVPVPPPGRRDRSSGNQLSMWNSQQNNNNRVTVGNWIAGAVHSIGGCCRPAVPSSEIWMWCCGLSSLWHWP
jgi:hypothetical protein